MKLIPISALLAPLEKFITEHGSAKIQEKHIALLKEQYSILEKENIKLTTENKALQSKISVLESEKQALIKESENLRKKIQTYERRYHNVDTPSKDYDALTHGLKIK
jgi:phage shock protein A